MKREHKEHSMDPWMVALIGSAILLIHIMGYGIQF